MTTPTVLTISLNSLTPLAYNAPLVTSAGNPTPQFLQLWNQLFDNFSTIQTGVNNLGPGGTTGEVQYNTGSGFGGFTVSGDGTLNTGTGVLIVTKTNGVSFAPSATTDTTNASNISSGTLSSSRLPTSGVTVGSYTNANITVDIYGRVTAASNGSAAKSLLPLANGDLPGPAAIADGKGQFIGVPV